jgi:hypothetical protein
MKPPQGRIAVGDQVRVPGGGTGRVIRERLIQSNGAWAYTVQLDGGATAEHLDFELRKLAAPAEG